MTPGLVGFIASGDERRAWEDAVAAALAALAAEFTVVRDPSAGPAGARRRTLLDTFDWRLYRAGLVLEHAAARRGGELRLSSADGAPPARQVHQVQQVTGWRSASPHLPGELPDGPVTARVGCLVAPRALLPVASLTVVTEAHRLLNSDGKTVARLLLERPSMPPGPGATARPAAEAVPLAPRLTIAEVRGYQGQARRAARAIAATPGVEPVTATAFAAALRALGRRPGDYSNKVDAAVTPAMSAPRAAATILLRLLDTIGANVPGVLADTDTEFLHDLRVSVRRTRSALKLFGDVLAGPAAGQGRLTGEELAFFAAEFKWVGDLTTPTRDLDVHLLGYQKTACALRAAKPDDLEPFRGYLEQRRRKEFRALARGLRSVRFVTLTQRWRERVTTIRQSSGGDAGVSPVRYRKSENATEATAGLLAAERTRVTFAKVAKRGAAITADSPADALHDLRKRCKELRYALEFFAPLQDRATSAKVVGDLKRLQDCLGEFQDTAVQIEEIRALATAMLTAGEAPAVTLLAMGEVTAGLAGRQCAARADFARRFAAFADVEGRRRMAELLRGVARKAKESQ